MVKNVYLIDDDMFFAEVFMLHLKKQGAFEIHWFKTIAESMKKISQVNPEIIFLDHELEGMNGVDAIPLYKEVVPASDIAIVSGKLTEEISSYALERGASCCFPKDALLYNNADGFLEQNGGSIGAFSSYWSNFFGYYKVDLSLK